MSLYASKDDLIAAYGAVNIFTWAKRDANIPDIDDPAIDATITLATDKADGDINAQFRDSLYVVPLILLDTPSQATVKDWATVISVWWLFKFRLVNSTNNPKTPKKNKLESDLTRVRLEMKDYIAGSMRLNASLARNNHPTAPTVIF